MPNSQEESSSPTVQPTVYRYCQEVFAVSNEKQARNIILTPSPGITTEERWELETAYLASEILKFLEPSEKSLILDFGCGLGRLPKAMLKQSPCRILGVDISVSMRQLAPGYVLDENFSVVSRQVFVALVANGLRVDAAIALWVLQHCPQVEREVDLIHQALLPSGRFYVLNNKRSCIPTIKSSNPTNVAWMADGTDLLAILQTQFHTLKIGTLPVSVTTPDVVTGIFTAELQKKS